MGIDFPAMKSEIETDPQALGYSLVDNALTATLLNDRKVSIQVARGEVPTQEVIDATVFSELSQATNQRLYIILTSRETIMITPTIISLVKEIFASGTTSRTQLATLQTRDGSRAEELFGVDTVITAKDVNTAIQFTA